MTANGYLHFWRTWVVACIGLMCSLSRAEDIPSLGQPVYQGSGCIQNTVQFVLSPDGQTLSVIYDDFRVEAGKDVPSARKDCTAWVPMNVPKERRITVYQADYRGFNSLPKGATSELLAQHDFEGSRVGNPHRSKKFKGPILSNFTESVHDVSKTNCGGTAVLKISTALIVSANSRQETAFSALDSTDLAPGGSRPRRKHEYRVKVKQCSEPADSLD